MLLVLHADLVNSGGQWQCVRTRVCNVGRRRPPNHEFAVQPDVQAVVAGAVQCYFARFGDVPEAAPAHAKEPARQVGIVIQEVEVDCGAGIVEERRTAEANVGKYLPAYARPIRQTGA